MASQPNETTAEDLRNALSIMQNLPEPHMFNGTLWCEVEALDLEAIRHRLEDALTKLDVASGRRGIGAMLTLHDEPFAADYVRPGQPDPTLSGQEITDDGE